MNIKECFNVYEIGRIEGKNKIVINKSFVKGLKYLSSFSHIIVIFSKELMQKTIEINSVDEKAGIITQMIVEEALVFFTEQSKVYKILETLFEVGLGYIK